MRSGAFDQSPLVYKIKVWAKENKWALFPWWFRFKDKTGYDTPPKKRMATYKPADQKQDRMRQEVSSWAFLGFFVFLFRLCWGGIFTHLGDKCKRSGTVLITWYMKIKYPDSATTNVCSGYFSFQHLSGMCQHDLWICRGNNISYGSSCELTHWWWRSWGVTGEPSRHY